MKLHEYVVVGLAAALAFGLGAVGVEAKGGKGPGAGRPAGVTTAKPKGGPKVTTMRGGAKGQTQRAAKAQGGPKVASAKKTTASQGSSRKAASTTTGSAKTKTTAKTKTDKKTASSTASPLDPPTVPTEPTPMNKAQQKIASNANLRARLQSRLPVGTDIMAAAAGFRNLGQFVAAVNVSHNLGISFDALRTRMTGDNPMSLGQAIQQVKGLNPVVAETTAQNALAQANAELETTAVALDTTSSKGNGKRRH
jgi:hypothetical protein